MEHDHDAKFLSQLTPRELAEEQIQRLSELLGRSPNGSELRAVATYLRSVSSELVARAGAL